MVVIKVNDNWQEIIDMAVPKMRERGWLEDLKGIRTVTPYTFKNNPHNTVIGQYNSYGKEVWLLQDHDGNEREMMYTLFHEVGHHLHYHKMMGPAEPFPTEDEWIEHFQECFEGFSGQSVEFVAEVFGDYHLAEQEYNEEKYEELNGPELGEPVFGHYSEEMHLW